MVVLSKIEPKINTASFNMDYTTTIKNKGDNITLNCTILSGSRPKPIIYWRKDGISFQAHNLTKTDKRFVTFASDNSSITFHSITKKYSGKYQCEAVNTAGRISGKLTLGKYRQWNLVRHIFCCKIIIYIITDFKNQIF